MTISGKDINVKTARVAAENEVLITRRGKPVGRLIAMPEVPCACFDLSALRDFVAAPAPLKQGLTVAQMREQALL